MRCYDCDGEGHIAADCPNRAIDASGKPPWCGLCDEQTRLIGLDVASRCLQCHPLARHSLKQHRKCPHCHMTVYQWDHAECGAHSGPAVPDRRPGRERIREIITAGDAP